MRLDDGGPGELERFVVQKSGRARETRIAGCQVVGRRSQVAVQSSRVAAQTSASRSARDGATLTWLDLSEISLIGSRPKGHTDGMGPGVIVLEQCDESIWRKERTFGGRLAGAFPRSGSKIGNRQSNSKSESAQAVSVLLGCGGRLAGS